LNLKNKGAVTKVTKVANETKCPSWVQLSTTKKAEEKISEILLRVCNRDGE